MSHRPLLRLAAACAIAFLACDKKREVPPAAAAASRPTEQAPAAAGEILLGEVSSLSGPEATFGVSSHNGIELALREINQAGGVKGRKLRVKVLDDQGRPEEAATAMTRLVTEDKVALVLGEVASTRSIAMAAVAENNRVPMISHASTNPKVTEGRGYVFRICFIDPFQGYVMAKFARENLKLQKVAVLKDVRNDYSIGLAQVFVARFKGMGGEVVKEEAYSAGDKDFRAQLAAIKAARPEAVYVPGYYSDVGLVARQARRLGLDIPLMGGDGWDSDRLYDLGGEAVVGSYFSNHYATQDPSPAIQKFIADYKAAYNEIPDAMAALGYDAAKIAASAIERAKSLSGDDLRDAIARTKGFAGVTGVITIDEKHNATKPAVVLKVADRKAVFQATISPEAEQERPKGP
jgi:branched-chain amino acid transport system substrate-binding protein